MKSKPETFTHARWILNAVEAWAAALAGDYWLVRETEAAVLGRIDGLLVPVSYDAHVFKAKAGHWLDKAAVIGVEVKASRADFLRGIREKQFDRYSESLAGLYVATNRWVKTDEVPKHCGHLVCYEPQDNRTSELRCVCKRHPTYRDVAMTPDVMWRLLFHAVKRMRHERSEAREEWRKARERVGSILERRVFAVMDRAKESVGAA